MTKVIITGGCGFIGHHLFEHIFKNTDWEITIIDKLSKSSKGYERLRDPNTDLNIYLNSNRVRIFTIDLSHKMSEGVMKEMGYDFSYIIHMAAETHVDNSIDNPVGCIRNNVMSTTYFLEYTRKMTQLKKFLYFSTDEVFGPALGTTMYKEWDRHNPTNPYSASKSAAEQICMSYNNTYDIPVLICNVMNVFGEKQYVEKFIPLCIKYSLEEKDIFIHSYPDKKTAGTRFYIHARNVADAIMFLINKGKVGEKYNITGEKEVSNLDMALFISKTLGKELKYKMIDFHSSRPGHDLRYGLDGSKLKQLGWEPPVDFYESLKKTILWTKKHREWLEP